MNNKFLKIFYAAFMAIILVCVVLLAVQDIRLGINTTTDKLIVGVYVLLVLYAIRRIYTLVKDLMQK
ncbi:MAG: hypothetical protein IKY95_01055 [Bacteroidales bacterium]|nr:hypothetical protein [Bacteroidales bacterium]